MPAARVLLAEEQAFSDDERAFLSKVLAVIDLHADHALQAAG